MHVPKNYRYKQRGFGLCSTSRLRPRRSVWSFSPKAAHQGSRFNGPRKCLGSESLQELHIQSNSTHEQVDTAQAIASHRRRQALRNLHSIENTVLDGENEARLLVVVRIDAHGCQELPNIHVFAAVDAAGENVRQRYLKLVEESLERFIPIPMLVLFRPALDGFNQPFRPLLFISFSTLLENNGATHDERENRYAHPSLGD